MNAVLVYAGCHYYGKWIVGEDKWTTVCFMLTMFVGINMSLLLRRTREGLSDRNVFTQNKLIRCTVLKGDGELTEKSMLFVAQCAQILARRFEQVIQLPGKILAPFGFLFSFFIVVVFCIGVPQSVEFLLPILSLPGVLYYLFIWFVYVDVVVQLDSICLDVKLMARDKADTTKIIPEVDRALKSAGL